MKTYFINSALHKRFGLFKVIIYFNIMQIIKADWSMGLGKRVIMSKKTKTTIYTSKKKRTAAAVVCVVLAIAMVLPLLAAALM